jgi:hypothetical protein
MYKKLLFIVLALLSLKASAFSLAAEDTTSHKFNLAFSLNASSSGLGIEVLSKPFKKVGFRIGHFTGNFGGNYYTVFENKSILVEGKFNYSMTNLFIDFYPFKKATFRITAGASYNQNKYQTILSPDDGEQIGFIFYSPDKLGNIVLTAKGNDISPYLGVGFGNNVPKYRVGLGIDLGLFYQGESKFDVEGNGSFKPSGTSENEAVLEDAFRQFVAYPFVNFSLRFRLIK